MVANNQAVIFGANDQKYALPIQNVSEIIRVMDITPVPNVSDKYKGVINLRGAIVPVLSLSFCLNIEERPLDKNARIIVVEKDGEKIGFTVENVYSVTQYSDSQVESPEFINGTIQFIKGIIHQDDEMIFLLDMEQLVS